MPIEALYCNTLFFREHSDCIEYFHNDIVNACESASREALATKTKGKGRITPGWNEQIKLAKEKAIFWHTLWKENDSYGLICEIRQRTRRDYHYALRKLKDGGLSLRDEKMPSRVLSNSSTEFWNEVNKIRGSSKRFANNVDGSQGEAILLMYLQISIMRCITLFPLIKLKWTTLEGM